MARARKEVRDFREILARCREVIGHDMLIQVRLNGSDYVNEGNTLEEVKQIAGILTDAGSEVIHVSAGMAASAQYSFLPAMIPRGFNVPLAEEIKKAVKVPVIACGAITDAEHAEEILGRGIIDLVAMGRPLMADPDLPLKSMSGRLEEVRPCLRCSKGAAVWPEDMRCTVNPEVGREAEFKIEPVAEPKKVVVIGAGPAGLETARIAAARGHSVTLIDQNDRIGGKILMIKGLGGKVSLDRWLGYYQMEMKKQGVQLEMNRRVTASDLAALEPDVIVVATGAKPLLPDNIEGIGTKGVEVVDDVLAGRAPVGDRVLIIGGSSTGVETAAYLAEQGKKVEVAEMTGEILSDISHDAALALLAQSTKVDLNALTDTLVTGIAEKNGRLEVRVMRYGLETILDGFDTVVIASGVVPDNALAVELKAEFQNVHLVGDCEKGGDFRKAVLDGAAVGMQI